MNLLLEAEVTLLSCNAVPLYSVCLPG